MRLTIFVPVAVTAVFAVAGCSGGNGMGPMVDAHHGAEAKAADASPAEAATVDAGPPDSLAFTWTNSIQAQVASFCVRCHGPGGQGQAQNFNCLYCADSTGTCRTSPTACQAGDTPGVAWPMTVGASSMMKHIIICGLLPKGTPAGTDGCPDTAFGAPFGQFPADCNLDDQTCWGTNSSCTSSTATCPAGAGCSCPTDAERLAIINWIQTGTAP
jgi:hypothetical protein